MKLHVTQLEITKLLEAVGPDFEYIRSAADALRSRVNGDEVKERLWFCIVPVLTIISIKHLSEEYKLIEKGKQRAFLIVSWGLFA